MINLKIILFSIGLLFCISKIIWIYLKEKQKPNIYDVILVIVFLWLVIKNTQKL